MRVSTAFNVTRQALKKEGVFDAYIGIDSPLYIDPGLLKVTSIPEFQGSYQKLTNYFVDVITLASRTKEAGDVMGRRGIKKLIFREIALASIGHSFGSNRGHGWGRGIASRVFGTAKQACELGIDDPRLFELVGLFEDKIGADLISDMILSVLLEDFLKYNIRVAEKLSLQVTPAKDQDGSSLGYDLPYSQKMGTNALLLPTSILSPLPIALDWGEISTVSVHNETLRKKINADLGFAWKEFSELAKSGKRKLLLSNADILRLLIEAYKNSQSEEYDIDADPKAVISWADVGESFAKKYPTELKQPTSVTELFELGRTICGRFAQYVTQNGLNSLLYKGNGQLNHERVPQKLFAVVADSYCAANNFSLAREIDTGRGTLDFQISKGHHPRLLIEIKYSKHSKLVSGYTKQLEEYRASQETMNAIYLIIQVDDNDSNIKKIKAIRDASLAEGKVASEVIVVDARIRPSASKL